MSFLFALTSTPPPLTLLIGLISSRPMIKCVSQDCGVKTSACYPGEVLERVGGECCPKCILKHPTCIVDRNPKISTFDGYAFNFQVGEVVDISGKQGQQTKVAYSQLTQSTRLEKCQSLEGDDDCYQSDVDSNTGKA